MTLAVHTTAGDGLSRKEAPARACSNCGDNISGKGRVYCTTCSCERQKERSLRYYLETKMQPRAYAEWLEYRRWWWANRNKMQVQRMRTERKWAKRRRLRHEASNRPCEGCGKTLGKKITNGRLSSRIFHPECLRLRHNQRRRQRWQLAVAA